jgi:hypothetical protein
VNGNGQTNHPGSTGTDGSSCETTTSAIPAHP